MMQLLSCFSLYELSSVAMTFKQNQRYWQREKALIDAKSILAHLEKNILSHELICEIPPSVSSSDIVEYPLDWWRQNACSGSFLKEYYYLVESLGNDPCASIKSENNHQSGAYYYRITLLVFLDNIKSAKLILQSTLAKPGADNLLCPDKIHRITPGRQMLRVLL